MKIDGETDRWEVRFQLNICRKCMTTQSFLRVVWWSASSKQHSTWGRGATHGWSWEQRLINLKKMCCGELGKWGLQFHHVSHRNMEGLLSVLQLLCDYSITSPRLETPSRLDRHNISDRILVDNLIMNIDRFQWSEEARVRYEYGMYRQFIPMYSPV